MPGALAARSQRARPERKSSAATLALWLALAGALLLLWFAYDTPIDRSPLRGAPAARGTPALGASEADTLRKPATIADYPEMTARPLFDATRRPHKPAPAKPPKGETADAGTGAAAPPLQAQLFGLTRSPARGPRALVRSTGETTGTWLGIGAEIQGWKLTEIASDRIVFRYGEQRRELLLSNEPAEKQPEK